VGFLLCALPAQADDAYITDTLYGIGQANAGSSNHNDQEPWKGWIYLTVTNQSNVAWGDFHFQIFSFNGQDVSAVDFIVDPLYTPTSSQNPLTWTVDNTPPTGSTLDLFFYSDPVGIGDTATFIVYTDNTATHVNFGVMYWATPVPEPSSLMALSGSLLGLAGLVWRRRR